MNFNDCINVLSEQLQLSLPGEDAQYKMAPMKRKKDVEKYATSKDAKHSGVLLLLYPKNDLTQLVLIRRALDNSHHSGQIGFPGGAFELLDENFEETALRETEEEIGVKANTINVHGALTKLFIPVSNFWVHPFIGSVNHIPDFNPDTREVDEILTYGLNYFGDENIVKQDHFQTKSGFKITAPYFELEKDKLWGATAMIMSEFLELLMRRQ